MAKKKKKQKEASNEKSEETKESSSAGFLRKQEKQIKIALLFMVLLIASVTFVYWLSFELKKFNYLGLEFKKVSYGKMDFYDAKFPLKNFETGEVADYFPYRFREDPRKLENIWFDGDFVKLKNKVGIISEQPEILECGDTIVSVASLANFLMGIGGGNLLPFAATINQTLAEEQPELFQYARCKEADTYSLIEFREGIKTKIVQKGNCYIVEVANCEIMNATEKFILKLYEDSQKL